MQLKHTWLPADTPDNKFNLEIISAHSSKLITQDNEIYDAISSWWCKPLGHKHPLVTESIKKQLNHFEHHIPANLWNSTIEALSTKLINIFTQMDKVVYASDGSSAIEIAMKLSYECRVLDNQAQRNKFIALSNGYHGETIFTLGVCGIDKYKTNFSRLLNKNYFIENITYVSDRNDPLWNECNFNYSYWDNYFQTIANQVTALVFEPIVQGAGGIKIISRDFLYKLANVARQYDIHIIADEIMVGLGRLGVLSVSKDIIGIEPDLVCFAKNLTAGSIPMSAVTVNQSISNVYREHNKAFYHSHTHSCNTLGAKVACNYIDYLNNSSILKNVNQAEHKLLTMFNQFMNKYSFISNVRVIGAIAALNIDEKLLSLQSIFELGIQHSIYLRNIDNTLYIMPPLYNINQELPIIEKLLDKVFLALNHS